MQKLSATGVKQAALKDKAYKMTDGGGLYLLVKPAGKYWRFNYRFGGKRKTLALGVFPKISLGEARKRHQAAKEELATEIDPSESKQTDKLNKAIVSGNTFELAAEEWFEFKMSDKSKKHKTGRSKSPADRD